MTSQTRSGSLTFSSVAPGSGLQVALAKEPAEVLADVGRSGLRGRGGAGFPTSLKWKLAAETPGEKKYVVCNADEGEPGTFKDRVILTDFADLVFEGMTVGARIIGAGAASCICGRNTRICGPIWKPSWPAAGRRTCWEKTSPAAEDSISTLRFSWARAPTSAARKPR